MEFLPMHVLQQEALKGGYGVPSFCVWNAENIDAVLRTAQRLKAPVILMNGPGEYGLLPPGPDGRASPRPWPSATSIPAALHLDPWRLAGDGGCTALEEPGYSSVMLDYSARPYRENVDALKEGGWRRLTHDVSHGGRRTGNTWPGGRCDGGRREGHDPDRS